MLYGPTVICIEQLVVTVAVTGPIVPKVAPPGGEMEITFGLRDEKVTQPVNLHDRRFDERS